MDGVSTTDIYAHKLPVHLSIPLAMNGLHGVLPLHLHIYTTKQSQINFLKSFTTTTVAQDNLTVHGRLVKERKKLEVAIVV